MPRVINAFDGGHFLVAPAAPVRDRISVHHFSLADQAVKPQVLVPAARYIPTGGIAIDRMTVSRHRMASAYTVFCRSFGEVTAS